MNSDTGFRQQNRQILLVTDLDGTLAVRGRIGESERQAAAELKTAGIPILVITGRNPQSMTRLENLWEVADEVLFASGTGRMTSPDAEQEELCRLGREETLQITRILDTFREDYCVLNPIPDIHHFSWRRYRSLESNPDFDGRMAIYKEWSHLWDESSDNLSGASQILVIRPPGAILPMELKDALKKWSVFHSSSPIDHESMWLEVFPTGVDKGSALSRWCRERGIVAQNVVCVGNDFNDLPMLEWAGRPFVVGNAPPELCSRFETLHPAGEGGFEQAVSVALRLRQESLT